MKTATVRELRNNFASLAKWIEHGERVTITRNGKNFATLAPATPKMSRARLKAAWKRRQEAFTPVGRQLTRAETEAFWSRLRD